MIITVFLSLKNIKYHLCHYRFHCIKQCFEYLKHYKCVEWMKILHTLVPKSSTLCLCQLVFHNFISVIDKNVQVWITNALEQIVVSREDQVEILRQMSPLVLRGKKRLEKSRNWLLWKNWSKYRALRSQEWEVEGILSIIFFDFTYRQWCTSTSHAKCENDLGDTMTQVLSYDIVNIIYTDSLACTRTHWQTVPSTIDHQFLLTDRLLFSLRSVKICVEIFSQKEVIQKVVVFPLTLLFVYLFVFSSKCITFANINIIL